MEMVGVLYEDDLDLQQSVLRMGEMERGKGKGKYVLVRPTYTVRVVEPSSL